MSEKVKWGIIGLGKIATKFAIGLQDAKNAELYAVASRDKSKAKDFAEQFEVIKSFGSYDELMKDEDVEVIYIATPHVFHHQLTLECIKHGKAVLCEKPFAMNSRQAKEMIAAAKENKIFLMEALWTAFLPHFQDIEAKVNSKEYGDLKAFKADFGFSAEYDKSNRLFNKSLGGGSLLDIGIYPVFLAYKLLGKPQSIEAKAEMTETGVDMQCEIQFNYPNGLRVPLMSTLKEDTPTSAELKFEETTIVINSRFHEPTSITTHKGDTHEIRDYGVENNGYTYEAEHVSTMYREGKLESDIWSHQNTLDLMELLDQIRNKINLEY